MILASEDYLTACAFDASSLAVLSDLDTPVWRREFETLERIQAEFVRANPHCDNYLWPRDPLHCGTRVWEYPYVYHNVKNWLSPAKATGRRILDLGSGVTFFPFAVSRLGCDVLAVDADVVSAASFRNARESISAAPGSVELIVSDGRSLAVDRRSIDCLYCISVLEHIPSFEEVIEECARVIKPGGRLILTVDIDLSGTFALGPADFASLQQKLSEHFETAGPIRAIHPAALLTSENVQSQNISRAKRFQRAARSAASPVYRFIRGRRPYIASIPVVATYGTTMVRG